MQYTTRCPHGIPSRVGGADFTIQIGVSLYAAIGPFKDVIAAKITETYWKDVSVSMLKGLLYLLDVDAMR